MIPKNYGIRCRVRLHIPISLPFFRSILLIVGGLEVSVWLLFEIMVMGSHTILCLLSIYESIRIKLLLVVVVLVGGCRVARVV